IAHRISRDEGGVIRSPAPALVVATPVETGAEIEAETPVLVLESMKMETVLRAPFRATLRERLVSIGRQVGPGAPLLRLAPAQQPDGAAEQTVHAAELDLPRQSAPRGPVERVEAALWELRGRLLGFDAADAGADAQADGVLADYLDARGELPAGDRGPLTAEV